MAQKGAALITMPGATGTGTGSITLAFGSEMTITYDNTIKFSTPMAASVGGQSIPMGNIPFQGAMDINEGNLGYTCSGSSATLIAPPPGISWKLDKA